jgi:Tripartite tricarboxylate transporter TctB family
MTEKQGSDEVASAGLSMRSAEVVVALFMLALGALVIFDSVRLGWGWGTDGPEAGYFPFYIGSLICIGSLVTLFQVLLGSQSKGHKVFVEWSALRLVLQVLLPAAVYVLCIQLIGIYVASAAYIAVFMVWLGKYGWFRGIIVGAGVSAVTFAMFEIWFQVPLFKGEFNPLSLIGY